MRGLRIKIMSGGGSFGSWLVEGAPRKGQPIVEVRDDTSGLPSNWIREGLASLKQLQFLEVELLLADWDNHNKIEWCKDLQKALDECRPADYKRIRVTSVEHAPARSK